LRTIIKHIVSNTYKPLLVKYLSKTRVYYHSGIRLEIPPQVFHPGFFTSTGMLLRYVTGIPLKGRSFLELGAGSGLIAIQAAKKGAIVTATDINQTAIEYLSRNARQNEVNAELIVSDLFDQIPDKHFDIIAINPPYYKKDAQTAEQHAWFCGSNGEYFKKLFSQIGNYIHEESKVIMVLCDGCDIEMILKDAKQNGFAATLMKSKSTLIEKNFIYEFARH